MWIHVYHNWKTNDNFKNGRNSSFFNKTKAWISFIPIRRMFLWCPITKRKGIITQIRVYPNWKTNFNSKNGRKISFSYETKPSISFIPIGECVYGAQSWNEKILLCKSVFITIERRISILKMVEIAVFRMKPKHQYHLSQ